MGWNGETWPRTYTATAHKPDVSTEFTLSEVEWARQDKQTLCHFDRRLKAEVEKSGQEG
jgi:hypothetical protein